ncbi:regulatory protein alcR (C6 zinc finger domain-containing protein) [Colletotrichum truncatum]|uniref:Regulatory protein alcR (C6 zinc finger domain-containing protein) n=1 Tax=Colletotrichum truncatum TaxID=5467 RepID=A0ACC3YQ42_COLTU|nr:regulatory protein alcR (C6 zinc finger domain-containing protein) [Colletotrichum truncatum]KAF6796718.1 regulatory protein alcR (C6 zinc finger domain-containing protein) [Colletotrichum truncatum]
MAPTADGFMLSPSNETVSTESFADNYSLPIPESSSTSLSNGSMCGIPGPHESETPSAQESSLVGLRRKFTTEAAVGARKRSWMGRNEPDPYIEGVSEFSLNHQIITRTNNGLMTDNLMKLYHDVMEGALSCWLTEQNCPYLELSGSSENINFLTAAWKPSPPNRVYHRVLKLDKSLSSIGLKPLGRVEDQKATKALHLAIMAFTAQWAQGSRRSQSHYNSPALPESDLQCFGDEFDATLQMTFWNQARKLLNECADLDCFKVAFAEIIFGLTQKYATNQEEYNLVDPIGVYEGENTGIMAKIQEVLGRCEHHTYTERAARRLNVLKRQVRSFDRKAAKIGTQLAQTNQLASKKEAGSEERRTMELIFWLAVMFDTLSAAMTERPVTVSDEESKEVINRSEIDDSKSPQDRKSSEHWNDQVIIKKTQKLSPLRWPCHEEDISRELRDAAPVKVLLFRKITRLQTLSSQGAENQTIEDAIQDALAVYRHWNMTYGPLFQDCIQYHNSLPSKVQSWYVCLLGHWLLAAMILADLVKLMDDQGLSSPAQASERVQTNLMGRLLKASNRMVSDLARVSTPRNDEVGKLTGYHYAANEGALLTEPWTMVLIRSITKAALSLLDEAENLQETANQNNDFGESLFIRCEDCVKALWYLGRKSDLARQVAKILGNGLEQSRLKLCNRGGRLPVFDESVFFDQVAAF